MEIAVLLRQRQICPELNITSISHLQYLHHLFIQGLCKFGFYEVFKNIYSGILGEENSYLYRTSLYLAASASAEFFADIALSPMESVKVSCLSMSENIVTRQVA